MIRAYDYYSYLYYSLSYRRYAPTPTDEEALDDLGRNADLYGAGARNSCLVLTIF